MNIADAVSNDYVSVGSSTTVSKLRGAFDRNEQTRVILVEDDDDVVGVVAEKDLLNSHHAPDQGVGSVMRSPPRVSRTEDVRETARLMVESELKLLPVYEGEKFCGVVTDRSLLTLVEPHLDALDVADVATRDLIDVGEETTLGEVIHAIRTHSISRVPVIEDGDPRGLISVHDLVDFTVRQMDREQGGSPGGFDDHGGSGSQSGRGYGERAGESTRLLDLPARDVMSTPVETIDETVSLADAVGRILDSDYSSLLVTPSDSASPSGIVTTTDVLRALTVTEDQHMDVQVFGTDLLDTLSREAIADRIESIDDKYAKMDVLEANVILQKHKERLRGTPLIRVTIRLFTDEGPFTGTAEEYGTRPAFDGAADVLEENVLEDKERKQIVRKGEKAQRRTEQLVDWWNEPESLD